MPTVEELVAGDRRLAEQLMAANRLTRDQLVYCIAQQRARGGPEKVRLAAILMEKGVLRAGEVVPEAAPGAASGASVESALFKRSSSGAQPALQAAPALTASAGFRALPPAPAAPLVQESLLSSPAPAMPARPMTPEIQAALADPSRRIGEYAILGELGRGAMGVVYRAVDVTYHAPVAIKMILGGDPKKLEASVKRFEVEASAATRLKHPAIVKTHEVGQHDGKPYLIMEFVEGTDLEKLFEKDLPQKWIAQLVRGIALALDHAHKNGVIHRDVKPENVIVDKEGQPHLTDFGVARDTKTEHTRMTQTGQLIGTPAYMAPEQAGDVSEIGPHSDIYSLGAVLYRALVGRPPFEATSMAAMVKQLLFEPPEPPRKIKPDIHPELEAITLRCLEKEPKKRFPSAGAVAVALEKFMEKLDAAPPEPAEEAAEPAPEAAPEDEDRSRRRVGRVSSGKTAALEDSGGRRRRRGTVSSESDTAEDAETRQVMRVLKILIPLGVLFFIVVVILANR